LDLDRLAGWLPDPAGEVAASDRAALWRRKEEPVGSRLCPGGQVGFEVRQQVRWDGHRPATRLGLGRDDHAASVAEFLDLLGDVDGPMEKVDAAPGESG